MVTVSHVQLRGGMTAGIISVNVLERSLWRLPRSRHHPIHKTTMAATPRSPQTALRQIWLNRTTTTITWGTALTLTHSFSASWHRHPSTTAIALGCTPKLLSLPHWSVEWWWPTAMTGTSWFLVSHGPIRCSGCSGVRESPAAARLITNTTL